MFRSAHGLETKSGQYLLMGHSRSFFVYFRPFQTILQNKNCRLSGIRTRIVIEGVEGEHADHLTPTRPNRAHNLKFIAVIAL